MSSAWRSNSWLCMPDTKKNWSQTQEAKAWNRLGLDQQIMQWQKIRLQRIQSGKSLVGPLPSGQCASQIYVSFVTLATVTVKFCWEQGLIHRWHFSKSFAGFGKGKNTFSPDSCSSFSFLGSLLGYLELLVHAARQQCFVSTLLGLKNVFYGREVFASTVTQWSEILCLSETLQGSNYSKSSFRSSAQRYSYEIKTVKALCWSVLFIFPR